MLARMLGNQHVPGERSSTTIFLKSKLKVCFKTFLDINIISCEEIQIRTKTKYAQSQLRAQILKPDCLDLNTSSTFFFFLIFLFICLCWVLVAAWGISFPDQGPNLSLSLWKQGVLATGPPVKSPSSIYQQCDLGRVSVTWCLKWG